MAELAKILGNAKANILALLGTAQGTAGTVQLITEDAKRATKALDEAKITYQETPVEEYERPNKAGMLRNSWRNLPLKAWT